MARLDTIIDLADFKEGFSALEDTTKAPFGSFKTMKNAQITDRGGIGPRPGTMLVGEKNENGSPISGLYSFKKSNEENEILVKNYDDVMEGLSLNHKDKGWFQIQNGYVPQKEFGYVHSLVNTQNQDLLTGSNRFDPYFSWTGSIFILTGDIVDNQSRLPVETTLKPDIYHTNEATASSTNSLQISSSDWVAGQWNDFYVFITSGPQVGKVRRITNTSSKTITFESLPGDPSNPLFEIRMPIIEGSGEIIYNGQKVSHQKVDEEKTLNVSNAVAAEAGTLVTTVPKEYPGNPRGNRFTNYLGRIVVGNVRSGLTKNESGNTKGYASGGSYFVSNLNDPLDFVFSSPRKAGEGDIQSMPYGGGDITDIVSQENTAYIFKEDYIESLRYSQDSNDIANRESIKSDVGSTGKTTKTADDIFFFTIGKQLTSLGRVASKDILPQTQNIGNKIKRYLDQADPSKAGRGISISSKVYLPIKSREGLSGNDVLLVYNINERSFEGIWDIGAFGIVEYADKYYYGSSNSSNVYQMLTPRFADVEGENAYGYSFEAQTHFFNLTSSKAYQQEIHGLVIEGYVRNGTTMRYAIYKDFSKTPVAELVFSADEEAYIDDNNSQFFYGDSPVGINSLSIEFGDFDDTGRRSFFIRGYFPPQYGNYFSVGIKSEGIDQDHETTRFGLMIKETPSVNTNRIKSF